MSYLITPPRPFTGRLLTIKQVQEIIGKSRSTINRWVNQKSFPAPVKIGPNSIAWSTDAVSNWINEKLQPTNSDSGEQE